MDIRSHAPAVAAAVARDVSDRAGGVSGLVDPAHAPGVAAAVGDGKSASRGCARLCGRNHGFFVHPQRLGGDASPYLGLRTARQRGRASRPGEPGHPCMGPCMGPHCKETVTAPRLCTPIRKALQPGGVTL